MNRLLLLVGLSLAAVACAGTTASGTASSGTTASGTASSGAAVAQKRDDVVCRMERPTGSHIAERVCRPRAAVDAERLQTQDALHTLPKATPSASN